MKVSIVIPYYNDRKFLSRAVESILNQSFFDFELILVNHATTDDCREIAHSYSDSRIIHMDMEKNYGAGTGLVLERILTFAKGEYIKLFCADDILYKDGLKTLVEYMDSHPQKDFAFGDVEYIDEEDNSLNKSWFKNRPNFNLKNDEIACLKLYFNDKSFLPYVGCIIKKSALDTIKIDKSFISYFDVSLWASLLIKGYKIGYIDEYIAGWRIHAGQMSTSKKAWKLLRLSEYEKTKYIELFKGFEDFELFKKVFDRNRFVKDFDNLTREDMLFILYYEMLMHNCDTISIKGYNLMYELLQDSATREYLDKKFGFGIKEFRGIYSYMGRGRLNSLTNKQLLYLLLKNFVRFVTFHELRTKKSKQECM